LRRLCAAAVHVSENVGEKPIDMLIVVPLSALPKSSEDK